EDAVHNFQSAILIDRTWTDPYIGLGRAYYEKLLYDGKLSEPLSDDEAEKERLELRASAIGNSLQAYWTAVTMIDKQLLLWQDIEYKKLRRKNEREVIEREYKGGVKTTRETLLQEPAPPITNNVKKTTVEEEEKYIKELHNTKAQLLWLIADVYAVIPDWSNCISTLKEAVSVDKKNTSYLCRLALAYTRAGKISRAKEIYEKCLKIDPDCVSAKQGLNDIK
ncbi:MAG: tetratricopeptide repeat protein, partial [Planctomycetota bacterium]